ncbi:MAG: DUF4180 domain-containing protein [Clostridiales bacterium]|nr:DUF4180 domain-containing protein [Clostridiales bacterium]
MTTKIVGGVAVIESEEVVIKDTASAIDLMMTVKYETGCDKIALNKEAFLPEFFILSKQIAGEILEKFITYQTKLAIYGDFSKYTSKPLRDFIYESNRGKDIFFVESQEQALQRLGAE